MHSLHCMQFVSVCINSASNTLRFGVLFQSFPVLFCKFSPHVSSFVLLPVLLVFVFPYFISSSMFAPCVLSASLPAFLVLSQFLLSSYLILFTQFLDFPQHSTSIVLPVCFVFWVQLHVIKACFFLPSQGQTVIGTSNGGPQLTFHLLVQLFQMPNQKQMVKQKDILSSEYM